MLLFAFIVYFFSITTSIIYFTLCFLLSFLIYFKQLRYYPKKNDDKSFHYKYMAFNRSDGHLVTFPRILFGVLGYYIVKFLIVMGSTVLIGLYIK